MIKRKILLYLREWYKKQNRKPLILRGARQTGKTTVINEFGKEFRQYIKLNLEKKEDLDLFKEAPTLEKLLQAIYFVKDADRSEESTLIFIDEIQNSPDAVKFLRFFYEELPNIAVIAAGSLLEIYLKKYKLNFPVGRIEYMYLHPVDFEEYLGSLDSDKPVNALKKIPVEDFAHNTLLEHFHNYTLIGGMPEACSSYIETHNPAVVSEIYENLITSYINDAAKYADNNTMFQVITHAIETAPLESGSRIKFHGFGKSNYRSREMGEALRTLERAMLIQLIYPVTNSDFPLLPDMKKSPRLQFIDTGLLNHHGKLQTFFSGIEDLNSVYAGKLSEQIVGQEMLAQNIQKNQKLLFWVREKSGSNSEVDFVIPHETEVIPVEVKSGKTGRLKSLHVYMDECNHSTAVRLYADKPDIQKAKTQAGKEFTLINLPYYLSGKLQEYLSFFY